MNHISTLLLIMTSCGVLGGAASYYASEIPPNEKNPLIKRIVLGLAASFVVPLFLNMISSSIIKDSAQSQVNYLVFSGFCILAAFSSKAFLSSISKKLLDKVDALQEKQNELKTDIDPILAKETEPEPDTEDKTPAITVDKNGDKILTALNNPKYLRRYLTGIIAETGIESTAAAFALISLMDKGLVQSKRGNNNDIFWLTSLGRNYVAHAK